MNGRREQRETDRLNVGGEAKGGEGGEEREELTVGESANHQVE